MRTFEIYDTHLRSRDALALLTFDESTGEAHISISPDARVCDLPLMLALFAERGEYELSDKWARKWIADRVPPPGRQNMGEILRSHGLAHYDEITLLAAACGRSAQDDCLIREVPATRVAYASVSLDEPKATTTPNWRCTLGKEIADIRRKAGMTQRELAEKTGIDQAVISRIESGRGNPTLDTLNTLAEGLDCTLSVLLSKV